MRADAPALLIDDGELESVRALLEQLGADFERIAGSSDRARVPRPETLLVTTAALARKLAINRTVDASVPRATWIAFVSNEPPAENVPLQTAGFDFLIREPVHPAALRVLLLRALFRGPEARRAPRVACGHPVTFKSGLWRQKATLVDLSPRGCRLLVAKPLKEKSELTLQIPKELAGGRVLELIGHAVRVVPAEREGGRAGETTVGVRFAPVEGETRTRLRALLAERVLGPAIVSANAANPAPAAAGAARRPTRVHKRAVYDRKVTAMDGNEGYMLMCRDISVGGMRIEPVEGLVVGSRLALAVQLSPREEPFLVDATVLRDDGELGLALQFAWIAPEDQQRLLELLEKLPSIEGLQPDSRSQGTFLAQRLSTRDSSD
ncbi:MAG: PilZ domain-containing protein [Myxococcota bacterium]